MSRQPLLFAASGLNFPPGGDVPAKVAMEANVRAMEESGVIDYVSFSDQMSLTIPRSIWSPDIVPSAANFDIDTWGDCFVNMALQGSVTPKIKPSLTSVDCIRRHPAVMAQTFLQIDHVVEGGSIFALAAGETKQITPYGIPRERIFDRLEDSIEIVKLLMNTSEPVDYDGRIWTMRDAILALKPYRDRAPQIWVAAPNPRAKRIAGQYADGWVTYAPGPCTPEQFVAEREEVREHVRKAGRDPDELRYVCLFIAVITDDAALLQRVLDNPIKKWDAIALVPSGRKWREWGLEHPFGDDWAYSKDMVPMEWSREDALRVIEQVPAEAVRRTHVNGSVAEATDQIQAYIDAGADYISVGNYVPMFETGKFGGGLREDPKLEVYRRLRAPTASRCRT